MRPSFLKNPGPAIDAEPLAPLSLWTMSYFPATTFVALLEIGQPLACLPDGLWQTADRFSAFAGRSDMLAPDLPQWYVSPSLPFAALNYCRQVSSFMS